MSGVLDYSTVGAIRGRFPYILTQTGSTNTMFEEAKAGSYRSEKPGRNPDRTDFWTVRGYVPSGPGFRPPPLPYAVRSVRGKSPDRPDGPAFVC